MLGENPNASISSGVKVDGMLKDHEQLCEPAGHCTRV